MQDAILGTNELTLAVVTLRLALALFCGGSMGFFRSMKKRGAGLKTHVLVCLGACLIMMTNEYMFFNVSNQTGDMARMASQVVSGVGFLGAGTILVTGRMQVKGLTTAAGLWACSGIGLALGIGFYSGAFVCTVLVFIVYNWMERIDEIAYNHSRVYDLYVGLASQDVVNTFVAVMHKNGLKLLSLELSKSKKNIDKVIYATMTIETDVKHRNIDVIELIESVDGVVSVEEL